MRPIGCVIIALLLGMVLGRGTEAASRPEAGRAVLPKLAETVTLDGELSDKAWQDAAYIAPFLDGQGNRPTAYATVGRAFFTDERLYFGLICLGRVPGEDVIRLRLMPPTGQSVVLTIAADGSVAVTPPETPWQVAVQAQKAGWTAECAVPLAALAPGLLAPRPGDRWQLRIERVPAASSPAAETVAMWPGFPAAKEKEAALKPPADGALFFVLVNLLPDGEAEEDADHDGMPDGWRITRDGKAPRVPDEAGLEHEWVVRGKFSLWTRIQGRTVIEFPTSLPLRRAATYRLTGYVWLPIRDGVKAFASLVVPEIAQAVPFNRGESYQPFEVVFRAAGDAVRPRLELSGDGGSSYVDACALEMIAMPPAKPRELERPEKPAKPEEPAKAVEPAPRERPARQ